MPSYPADGSDAIIVGAGPAGSATALLLARSGLDVLLLDRRAFPRPKPCGDCLSAAATDVLRRLGVLDDVLATRPARLDGWTISSPGGRSFTGRFPAQDHARPQSGARHTALAVERAVLDRTLLDAARAAGARFRQLHVTGLLVDGVGVTARDGGRHVELQTRLVVGADGLRSTVAARLGAVRHGQGAGKVSLTTHVDGEGLTADPRLGEMHLVDGACLGIAPVNARASRWNVTLVVTDPGDMLRQDGPAAFFAAWLERFGQLQPSARRMAPDTFLASGPFNRPVRSPVARGVALVGDAAGYFDPFTGQGIFRALASAELLAETVAPVLGRGAGPVTEGHLAPYARARRRMVAGPVRLQKLIDTVLARPRLADAAIGRLHGAGRLADRLVAVTGDLRRPTTLLDPRLVLDLMSPSREDA